MKTDENISINLKEELLKIQALELSGGHYEEGEEPETEELDTEADSAIKWYVKDATAKLEFGPYRSRAMADKVANRRRKKYPDHIIIVYDLDDSDGVNELQELTKTYWVVHKERNFSYGPYDSYSKAQREMRQKKKEWPSDTFWIEEDESLQSIIGQAVFLRVRFSVKGMGSFLTGQSNTINGTSGAIFRAGTHIGLTAKPATGHVFSHWILNGNFGGTQSSRNVRVTLGLSIVAVFKPE